MKEDVFAGIEKKLSGIESHTSGEMTVARKDGIEVVVGKEENIVEIDVHDIPTFVSINEAKTLILVGIKALRESGEIE